MNERGQRFLGSLGRSGTMLSTKTGARSDLRRGAVTVLPDRRDWSVGRADANNPDSVQRKFRDRSPTKETVRVIPFGRLIEVQTARQRLAQFRGGDRFVKPAKQRRRASDSHVGEQPVE